MLRSPRDIAAGLATTNPQKSPDLTPWARKRRAELQQHMERWGRVLVLSCPEATLLALLRAVALKHAPIGGGKSTLRCGQRSSGLRSRCSLQNSKTRSAASFASTACNRCAHRPSSYATGRCAGCVHGDVCRGWRGAAMTCPLSQAAAAAGTPRPHSVPCERLCSSAGRSMLALQRHAHSAGRP